MSKQQVSIFMGGTGANTASDARTNLGAAPSAAYDQANSAFDQANSAFGAANNSVLKAGDTMTGQLNISSGGLLVTGNVSIGTSTPIDNLDVYGGITISTTDAFEVTGSNSTTTQVVFKGFRGDAGDKTGTAFRIRTRGDGAGNASEGIFDTLDVERFRISDTETVFNDPGNDIDFRIESDTVENALFVQGSDGFVGIGTNAPSRELDVAGNITADDLVEVIGATNAYMRITSADGAGISQLRLGDAADLDVGAITYDHTSNFMAVRVNAAERLRVDSSGNVGIGTSSPTDKVQIVGGNLLIGTDTGDAFNAESLLRIQAATGNRAFIQLKCDNDQETNILFGDVDDDVTGAIEYSHVDDSMRLNTLNNNERMRITSAGNVGIGTTTPDGALHVKSSTNKTIKLDATLADGTSSWTALSIARNGTDKFRIFQYGDDRGLLVYSDAGSTNSIFLANTGSVGIGTSSPDTLLHLSSTSYPVIRLERNDTTIASPNPYGVIEFEGQDSSPSANGVRGSIQGIAEGGQGAMGLVFSTAENNGTNTERARITSGGDLLVGTTTTTAKFNITNGSERQISQYINNTNASPVGVQIRYATDINGTSNRFIDCIGDATTRFLVFSNGNVQNTNNSYGSISDEKTKQDIVDAASQWDDIKNVRVRKFRFKNNPDGALQIGVVAQELETVSPGLVDESIDQDGEGNDLGTTTKSVKYSVLYMKAIKALQEAMTRIEVLEAEVAALKGAN